MILRKALAALVRLWDDFVFDVARSSIRRKVERHDGLAYLLEREIGEWRDEFGFPESLKKSVDVFHDAMLEESRVRNKKASSKTRHL